MHCNNNTFPTENKKALEKKYPLLFNPDIFQLLPSRGKNNYRTKLYDRLLPTFNPEPAVLTLKNYFLYPDKIPRNLLNDTSLEVLQDALVYTLQELSYDLEKDIEEKTELRKQINNIINPYLNEVQQMQ